MKQFLFFTVGLGFVLMMWAGEASAVALTNTNVNKDDICKVLFDCTTPYTTPLLETSGSVSSAVTVLSGQAGSKAEGLFLYNYDLLVDAGSPFLVDTYSLSFSGLFTTLGMGGSGVAPFGVFSTSYFCRESCGKIHGSVDAGLPRPFSAELDGGALTFTFIPSHSAIDGISADFGAISAYAPVSSLATIVGTGGASPFTIATFVPGSAAVPEPATLLLVSMGIGAMVLKRRSRA